MWSVVGAHFVITACVHVWTLCPWLAPRVLKPVVSVPVVWRLLAHRVESVFVGVEDGSMCTILKIDSFGNGRWARVVKVMRKRLIISHCIRPILKKALLLCIVYVVSVYCTFSPSISKLAVSSSILSQDRPYACYTLLCTVQKGPALNCLGMLIKALRSLALLRRPT